MVQKFFLVQMTKLRSFWARTFIEDTIHLKKAQKSSEFLIFGPVWDLWPNKG